MRESLKNNKMKNYKNYLLTLIVFVCTSVVIISCSQDSKDEIQEYTYTSGKLSLNEYLNSSNTSSKSTNNSEDITVEAIFVSNIEIPENLNDEDLNIFLEENSELINGTFTYIMNDEIIYNSEFNNGEEEVSAIFNTNNISSKNGNCSYEGVRQCTIQKIDELSDWKKVVCAFRRGCVLTKIAACIGENC
jgi:hypothetical protein